MKLAHMQIDLLRHGQVEGGERVRGKQSDEALTEAGREQMLKATETGEWDHVCSSELMRCSQFAKDLAQQKNINHSMDQGFAEIDFGLWSGMPTAELWTLAPDDAAAFFSDPNSLTPPSGESYVDFHHRVLSAWEILIRSSTESRVLLVTHSLTIRTLVAEVLQLPSSSLFRFDVPFASMTRIAVYSNGEKPPTYSLQFLACCAPH